MKYILSEQQYYFLIEQDKKRMDALHGQIYQPKTTAVADKTRVVKPQMVDPVISGEMKACKAGFSKELLKQAINWWKSWIKNPITLEKFMENWNMNQYLVREVFKKYEAVLDYLEIIYFHDPNDSSLAYVFRDTGSGIPSIIKKNKIYVNCYYDLPTNQKLNTLIHEIQHILFNVKPFHPKQDISKSLNFNYFEPLSVWEILLKNLGLKSDSNKQLSTSSILSNKKKKDLYKVFQNFKKDGVKTKIIEKFLSDYKRIIDEGQNGYVENQTEILSRLFQIRSNLGIKPGQNITVPQFVKLVNEDNEDIFWTVMSIIHSGKTIKEVLDTFNSFAKNNPNPKTKSSTYQV